MIVINTLDPGLILKTFKSLQKAREQKKQLEAPIQVRHDYLQ